MIGHGSDKKYFNNFNNFNYFCFWQERSTPPSSWQGFPSHLPTNQRRGRDCIPSPCWHLDQQWAVLIEHSLLLPAAISIYEMKYLIWNSNIFTYCDVKSKQHKCYKRSFFHSESKSQSPIKMNLFFYNSAVPRRPHNKVFQASSNVWSCSPTFFFCSDVVGPYIILQISAFFLFSNFLKGRLPCVRPVGRLVG